MNVSTFHGGGDSLAPFNDNAALLPSNIVELVELRSAAIEHRLGYFRDEPFVIFAYCPGAEEVMWKDGHSSGFGTGGWKIFLHEIVPLAARHDVRVGDLTGGGTHVLLMDRIRGAVYAMPRDAAQDFLSRAYGIDFVKRRCLCSLITCAACPVRTCARAGAQQMKPTQKAESVEKSA